jgi:hypothetical protein
MKEGKRLCIPKLPRLNVLLNPEIPNDISWISKNDHHPDSLLLLFQSEIYIHDK